MDVKELVFRGEDVVKAYVCGKCRKYYGTLLEAAKTCCTPNVCNVCEVEVEKPWLICPKCKEEKRFNAATKVPYSEYTGDMLYDESLDKWFHGMDEVLTDFYYDKTEPPEYVFGTKQRVWNGLDIRHILGNELEDYQTEDNPDYGYDRLNDLEELVSFVKEWNKKQNVFIYDVDYKTIVLLPEDERQDYIRELEKETDVE